MRALREHTSWEVALVRTTPLATRPTIPHAVRDRVHVRSLVRPEARAAVLADAAILVPAPGGSPRLRLEAMASGCAIASPPGLSDQPELAAAAVGRLIDDPAFREREARPRPGARRGRVLRRGRRRAGADLLLARAASPRHARRREPLADRDWIVADLHMHTRWSHDCSVPVARSPRARGGGGARRDRRHRPQRLLRRAGGRRAGPRPRADRDPGRGGEDRRARAR